MRGLSLSIESNQNSKTMKKKEFEKIASAKTGLTCSSSANTIEFFGSELDVYKLAYRYKGVESRVGFSAPLQKHWVSFESDQFILAMLFE